MEGFKKIVVFGGSGFVGRYLVNLLARNGWTITVACRHPSRAKFLTPLGNVGQIQLVNAYTNNIYSLREIIAESCAVINLIGILFPTRKQNFHQAHVIAASNIAEAAKLEKIETLIHMSALGADVDSKSAYAKTKAEAEVAVKRHFPAATIIRPSVIFGREDQFFNRFAQMAKISPALPLIGGGQTPLQPVYVGDVALAFVNILNDKAYARKTIEIIGPTQYTMKEILQLTLNYTGKKRFLINIPYPIARLIGFFAQILPNPPLTVDQVHLLEEAKLPRKNQLELKDLGITPATVEAIVPTYLKG